jgi:lipid-A-disaccharide synthase-like uncharacterized protein
MENFIESYLSDRQVVPQYMTLARGSIPQSAWERYAEHFENMGIIMSLPLLADWSNFYVIVGSAAAGLTGLTFVVITLSAEANRASAVGLRTFVTPTIVHFGAALALAAFLSVPHLALLSLSVAFGAGGLAGLLYIGAVSAAMRSIKRHYIPVREDWLWNVIAPALVYAALLGASLILWYTLEQALYVVAAVSVALLFIGIRNAWDVAVWNSSHKGQHSPEP